MMLEPRTVRRHTALSALVVLLLASLGALAAPPPAAQASPLTRACPWQEVPATAFVDTVRSTHRAAIDCLAWWEVTGGRTATEYGVDGSITRGQLAAMLTRLLEGTGAASRPAPPAGFHDTIGHRFQTEIDLLAHLGIIEGVSATRFEPNRSTTRAQMASLLVRLFELGYDAPLPPASMPFRDVAADSVHHDAIGRLVGAQIAAGVTATHYRPNRDVQRGQMASFLMRSASRLVAEGHAERPSTEPGARDPFHARTRGAWVHLFDDTLKTRSSIRRMVAEMDAAGVNLIVAQVARRHDAYYDSDVLPPTPDPTLADGLDVLDEVLTAAHARGIEVHAWISVAPAWHRVYEQIGATPSDLGTKVAWRTRTVDGNRSTYLDPGLPEVQRHVRRIVTELAQRYPVDGIHLDYVRYESNRHGYHPDALARFRAETGRSGTPAPDDVTWSQWRRSQTRTIIRDAQRAIAAVAPDVELSAAVISWGDGPRPANREGFRETRTFNQALQNWESWVRDGHIDAAMPMNYFREHDADQASWYRQWLIFQRRLSAEHDARVVPGIGGYLNRPAAVIDQAHLAMQRNDGVLVYSVQQPTSDHSRGVWQRLADTRWGYPPAPPVPILPLG